jgi:glucosamine kinase
MRLARISSDLADEAAMLFLGIDGGGTKCRARIRDGAGRMLGESTGGPANIHQDFAGTVRSILTAAKAASQAGNLDELHAGLGLAGIETLASLRPLQDALPFATLTAINDAPAACLGAHGGADGGIVIAGTGSAGCAIVAGVTTVIGGWGFELGDHGSGAIMGREAVRAAVLSLDGLGPRTEFTQTILGRIGQTRPDLAAWAKAATTADYATYAPDCIDHADRGDLVARPIVTSAADAITAIAKRLIALGANRLCLLGGLAPGFRERLPATLRGHFVEPAGDAMDGAIMAARRAAGLPAVPEGGPS